MKSALAFTILLAAPAWAQPRPVDTRKSVMTVHVSKSGVLSALGHNHEIAAPISAGKVDTAAHTVELQVRAGALEVRDPGVSDKDRSETQTTMLGPEVLDASHHQEIAFHSTSAEKAGDAWKVHGELTLHGERRPVTVEVREVAGHFEGTCRFKQTDFGIKPVKAGGGTVRVKDEIRLEFQIYLEH